MAITFNMAPTIKNKFVLPVHANKYGKIRAVIKAPKFPAIFMVPDTAPECSFPISAQNAQDDGNVISAPKMAILKNRVAPTAVFMKILPINPMAANANPMTAGKIRDFAQFPFLKILSPKAPENQLPKAPKTNGIAV